MQGDAVSRAVVIVLALAVLAALVDAAVVRHRELAPRRVLVASGSAEVEVEPDIARISLGVKATRDTPTAAATEVRKGVASIKAALADLGVGEDAIETSELYLGEAQEYNYQTRRTELLGYKAYHWLRVTLKNEDFDKLPDVVDSAIAAGATRLHDLTFELEDDTPVRARALAEATQAARLKAQEMAGAAGARIVGVQRISQPYGGYRYDYGMPAAEAGMAEEPMMEPAAEPPAAGGEITAEPEVPGALHISAEVEVAFLIE